MAMNGVDHVVIRVKDFEEAVQTWRDKLGLDLERTAESEPLGIKQAFFPWLMAASLKLLHP